MNPLRKYFAKSVHVLSLAACVFASSASAQEAAYPSKPVRWMVYFAAGGGSDYMTRAVAERVSNHLGQTVVVENRPGASGVIGIQAVARSAPDGYTLLTGETGGIAMNPSLFQSLPYDTARDLQPVSLFARIPFIWAVNPKKVPVQNFREFVAYVKANPGKVTYASYGAGSIAHVMTELLKSKAGLDLVHIPYKGAGPATQDLISGQVDAMFTDYPTAKGFMGTDKMRILAISTKDRSPLMPDIPAFEESGVSDYDIAVWLGMFTPARTPKAVVDRLTRAVDAAVKSPEVSNAFKERGIVPVSSTPAEFDALIKSETAKWAQTIKAADIKLD